MTPRHPDHHPTGAAFPCAVCGERYGLVVPAIVNRQGELQDGRDRLPGECTSCGATADVPFDDVQTRIYDQAADRPLSPADEEW